MHMICPSMPIHISTELTEFVYISCRKKYLIPLSRPLCWRPGAHAPCPLPNATVAMFISGGANFAIEKLVLEIGTGFWYHFLRRLSWHW